MRIMLFGATGMIGSRVAAEARRRGHKITGVTRGGKSGTRVAVAR
jgi:putative NADH-flavin reductase